MPSSLTSNSKEEQSLGFSEIHINNATKKNSDRKIIVLNLQNSSELAAPLPATSLQTPVAPAGRHA
jgi:hypothetical protein